MHKSGVRGIARKLALDALGMKTALMPNKELQQKPRVQFIYIHHIFKDEEAGFEKMLKTFQQQFTFIGYSEAVNRIKTGNIDRPCMAFSSDDGFKNNLDAARILEQHGATACFFLNPGTINLTDQDQIQSHCASRLHFPPVEFLTWDEVADLQKRGHEIGSHTMWHAKLSEESIDFIQDDLAKSKAALESHCGPIEHFAYPYGRWFHFSKEALDATWQAGYTSCASAERGCHLPTENVDPLKLVLRRDHLLANWPVPHMKYFMENNAQGAQKEHDQSPFS